MFKKGSKLYSIFRFKCPHCHEGEFFVSRNPYNLSKAGDIHKNCPVCGRNLSIEPGFYYGAMYVAYALAVLAFLITFGITYMINPEASTATYIIAICMVLVVLGPWMYALSKTIWANMFVHYKGKNQTDQEIEQAKHKGKLGPHAHAH